MSGPDQIMPKPAPQRAMILAAGLGLRMRPITIDTPKPLIAVANKALIDWGLDRFAEAGVESVVVNIHHLGEMIEKHLRNRRHPKIIFSPEDRLLETGGGLLKALPSLGNRPFFVANADMLWLNGTTNTLARMADAWNDNQMDILMLLNFTVDAHGYNGNGDYHLGPLGQVIRRQRREVSPYTFTGLQIIHPRLLDNAPDGPFSLRLLYDRAMEKGRLYGIVHDGEWFHVGSPQGLDEAEEYMRFRYQEKERR